jgi:hypothetical protein
MADPDEMVDSGNEYILDEPRTLKRVYHGKDCERFKCSNCQKGKLCIHELCRSITIALSLKKDVPCLEMFQAVRTILAIFGSENKSYIVCVECVEEKRKKDADWQLTAEVSP